MRDVVAMAEDARRADERGSPRDAGSDARQRGATSVISMAGKARLGVDRLAARHDRLLVSRQRRRAAADVRRGAAADVLIRRGIEDGVPTICTPFVLFAAIVFVASDEVSATFRWFSVSRAWMTTSFSRSSASAR